MEKLKQLKYCWESNCGKQQCLGRKEKEKFYDVIINIFVNKAVIESYHTQHNLWHLAGKILACLGLNGYHVFCCCWQTTRLRT